MADGARHRRWVMLPALCVSGATIRSSNLYHLVSKDIRSPYNNSVPISG